MTRTQIIDHLRAGRPVTAKVVKEIVGELEFSRKQDAELKRLLAMQSDLDLQGYEHMRDELLELRAQLAESEARVNALEEALREIRSAAIRGIHGDFLDVNVVGIANKALGETK